MRVNGFQCDVCCKIGNDKEFKGWLFVRDHETNSGYHEFHFCSAQCLGQWASGQQKVETIENMPFLLSKENADILVKYVKEMGWDAAFKTRKDLSGKQWEQFQAVKDGSVIHIDSDFFRGMTSQQMCKYIDEYIAKYSRS
jgi:hypothetical protein